MGRKSDCIIGIRHLKRKQTSCYKPRDLWSQQDDLPFQKYAINKQDRCHHKCQENYQHVLMRYRA
jgi:hypothetical protein